MIRLSMNGKPCATEQGMSILRAAHSHGIYIPSLCHHPDLPPQKNLRLSAQVCCGEFRHSNTPLPEVAPAGIEGCGLCWVEVAGLKDPVRACCTDVSEGMSIRTNSDNLKSQRQLNLMNILAKHPHACLTCAQREGCSREDCSSNVPRPERCCWKFHSCELRKIAEYVGVKTETPRYQPPSLPVQQLNDPLIERDYRLCISCSRCVRVCRDIKRVDALGMVFSEDAFKVGSHASSLSESKCVFCGSCIEVCPTGALRDRDLAPGEKTSQLIPCVANCPAALNVPGYIRLIAQRNDKEAAALIRESLPIPNTLAYICFHDCENECRRGKINEPIAICALKRFAVDEADKNFTESVNPGPSNGKKIAVVGSGPAGLSAAYFLRFKGYDITVFESSQTSGGVPAQAIPRYRLPDEVIQKDVAFIEKLGVNIIKGNPLLPEKDIRNLLNQGFGAVLVSTGLPISKKIPVEARKDLFWGLEFLKSVKQGTPLKLGNAVTVVGGGNVAIDAAMTALRISGGRITLFCLESPAEMPAHSYEVLKAKAEDIEIHTGWGNPRFSGTDVIFEKCLSVFNEKRAFEPKFDAETTKKIHADSVILAIGQSVGMEIPREGQGLFLAGDAAGGILSVVHAVSSGRRAAEKMDVFLGGNGDLSLHLRKSESSGFELPPVEGFSQLHRTPIPTEECKKRKTDFRPIELSYSKEQARLEASRCLQCDLRFTLNPVTLPPEPWIKFETGNIETTPEKDGVIILADENKKPLLIKGTPNMRSLLKEHLNSETKAFFFRFEEERMYTQRENELIQQHLSQYGEMPGNGNGELDDDLF